MTILRQMELNSQKYMASVRPLVDDVLNDLAVYVGAKRQNVVLVEGSTTAANTILRSLKWKKGDKIMYLNTEYGMIKKSVEFIQDVHDGIVLVVCNITIPTKEEHILSLVNDCMSKHSIRLAIFDHISSFPTMVLPIKNLIELARKSGAMVMIDGAHALGQVKLNLTNLDPDFYFSSAHKWLCSTKGSAFLYVKEDHQKYIHPTVISHWYKQGFQAEFRFIGSRDYSSFLSFKEAIRYRNWINDDLVHAYNNKLCQRIGLYATQRWKTQFTVPQTMRASLIDIPIPCDRPLPQCYSWNLSNITSILVQKGFTAFFGTFEDKRYWRVSCQIYNEFSDYINLIDAFESTINS